MKGNVIDMAVGVVIGGAFGKNRNRHWWRMLLCLRIGLLVGGVNLRI